jgi:hypothetical protein
MHLRGSVLTRVPIVDAPSVPPTVRDAGPPLGAAAILARVAAASYVGTLAAWSAGLLVLGAVRHGPGALLPTGAPAGMAVYLGALVVVPILTLALHGSLEPDRTGLAARGPLK